MKHPVYLTTKEQRSLTEEILLNSGHDAELLHQSTPRIELSGERKYPHKRLNFADKEFIIRNHTYLTINTIALALEVPAKKIQKFLRAQNLTKIQKTPKEVIVWHDV